MLALGTFVTFQVAPSQEVIAQRGVDADRDEQDATTVGAVLGDVSLAGDTTSIAFFDKIDYPTVDQLIPQIYSPGGGPKDSYRRVEIMAPLVEGLARFAGRTSVKFVLRGQDYSPVLIRKITARVVSSEPPPSGTLFVSIPQGGSDAEKFGIDLDSDDRSARVQEDYGQFTRQRFFDSRQISLSKGGDPVTLVADIYTARCICGFVLDVELDDDSIVTVSNPVDGGPFYVSAYATNYEAAYTHDMEPPYGIENCAWRPPDLCE